MKYQIRNSEKTPAFSQDIHPVLQNIYAGRGVFTDSDLNLDIRNLHPPALLKNIDVAVEVLLQALQEQQSIVILGDFDADGATSCAVAVLSLRAMGFQHVEYLVPNRFEYGYGLTPEIVDVASHSRPDLIITVDNGIASVSGVSHANSLGIKVLVTDHHLPGTELPDAACILNPNQTGCTFPSKALAGVGVIFYLMSALRSRLRSDGWFTDKGLAEPNMAQLLDLVALGTVADVVPLDQNNRRLVKYGLNIIRSGRGRPGIRALLEVAGRNPDTIIASDLGFAAGPRLNAAGRLDDMALGIECLLADDPYRANTIAKQLDALNKDRRQIEQTMQAEALQSLSHLEIKNSDRSNSICLFDESWHQGVIGILASRIKDKYHRPVIAFATAGEDKEGNALIKGSARSIPGLHMRDLLDQVATHNPAILQKFGGHAMAAGLAIKQADYEAFVHALEKEITAQVNEEILEQRVLTDGELEEGLLDLGFAATLREAGPWGQHFPEPVFQGQFNVISSRVLADKHLKLVLQVENSDRFVDAIAFNQEPEILQKELETITLIYRLDINEFRGNTSLQLMVEQLIPL